MADGRIATIGMFDGVHAGHRHVLRQLCAAGAERGLMPTVFTFDTHPLRVIAPERAPKLLGTMAQRADLLIGAGAEEVVFMGFDERLRRLTDREFVRLLRDRYDVRALLVGFNHRFGYRVQGGQGSLRSKATSSVTSLQEKNHGSSANSAGWKPALLGHELGVDVIACSELDFKEGRLPACDITSASVSSSVIRKLLLAGDIAEANAMLGYSYALRGTVVHGRGLGHTIGFPTVNVEPLYPLLLVPAGGVYAAEACLRDGSAHPAMVNIGSNPTVNPGQPDRTSIEAHLIGFDGDLYDQPITLRFVRRLRDERRFPSLSALRRQLEDDKIKTKDILGAAAPPPNELE